MPFHKVDRVWSNGGKRCQASQKRGMNGQVPVPSPRNDGEGASECAQWLARSERRFRTAGVCVEAGSQTSDKQTSSQPPGTRVSGGGSLSRLLALPRVWVWLWVQVLGDRRPKGIGWPLAPEVR